jgi:hypothetical protein
VRSEDAASRHFSRQTSSARTFGYWLASACRITRSAFCTDVTAVGTGFFVQGFFRDGLDFQGLAVDTTGGRGLGNLYITWQDGRNLNQTDPFDFVGVGGTGGCPVGSPPGPGYCFGDGPIPRMRRR